MAVGLALAGHGGGDDDGRMMIVPEAAELQVGA
jgi:hypothetical protein